MAFRDELQKRIERKRSEIAALEKQLRDATIYAQALEDTLKLLPRDGRAISEATHMRTGSSVAKAKEALQKAGHPLHIVDLLKAIGRPDTRSNRIGLSGSIAAYVRKGDSFTRPAPNTFGLTQFAPIGPNAPMPPSNFGIDEDADQIPFEDEEDIPA